MCDYMKLLRAKADLLATLDILINDAEENYEQENLAATSIQRVFRGRRVRERIHIMRLACCEIERVFRGHLGRNKFRYSIQQKQDSIQYSIFEYFALQIQKIFRGFYSRKYRKNHANRKKYLSEVAEKGEQVRRMLFEYAEAQKHREKEDKKRNAHEEFCDAASSLHHLVSTTQIRGVFNPPQKHIKTPTVDGAPVEDHLRGVVRDLLRTKGITKTGLVVDMNGSRRVPYKGMKSRLSLQASAPYHILDEEQRRQRVLHRILTLHPEEPFVAGGLPRRVAGSTTPLCVGDPYMDPWANPVLTRGVPESQKQLNESSQTRKSLFAKVPDKPFYLATGGNKSAVLPSGIFDVIADAEESGGNTKRHQASTRRFGLPESADNRPRDGSVPAPPIRTTASLKHNIKTKHTYHIHAKASKYSRSQPYDASFEDAYSSSDEGDDEENRRQLLMT